MRIGVIAANEATRGSRIRVRAALLDAGWSLSLGNMDEVWNGADFLWLTATDPTKSVGVQSKTLSDFFGSWIRGTLQREMDNLMQSVDIPILLLEGVPRERDGYLGNEYGRVTMGGQPILYKAFAHAFLDFTMMAPGRFGIVISPDDGFTVQWLKEYGPAKYDDPNENRAWNRQELPDHHPDPSVKAIMAWPGLGPELARRLLAEWGTVFGVLDALRNGLWGGVTGISRGKIKGALELGNRRYQPEGDE